MARFNIEEIVAEETRERIRSKLIRENKLCAEITKLYELLRPIIANTEAQATTKQESA